jgi:hypothetical protein
VGDLYQYYYRGGLDLDGVNRKQLPTFAFCGNQPMRDVSGPGHKLDGSSSDAYSYCIANAAGECVSGSQPGDMFFNCPNLSRPYCHNGIFWDGVTDVCMGDMPATGIAMSQIKTMADSTGKAIRPLMRMGAKRAWSSFSNTKPLPDGSWTIVFYQGVAYLLKVPPIPPDDGVDRTRFISASLQLKPPSGKGVQTAVVRFGYAENGSPDQYFCTSRQEACVVTGTAHTDANPFQYEQSESYSPAPCAAGCSVTIPVLPGRVAYYEARYLGARSTLVATDHSVAMEG